MNKLLRAILYSIGFSLVSLPLVPFVMGILWIFVFGDNPWSNILGIDPIIFIFYTLPTLGAITGFVIGWRKSILE
jgi:hypothetical protein